MTRSDNPVIPMPGAIFDAVRSQEFSEPFSSVQEIDIQFVAAFLLSDTLEGFIVFIKALSSSQYRLSPTAAGRTGVGLLCHEP